MTPAPEVVLRLHACRRRVRYATLTHPINIATSLMSHVDQKRNSATTFVMSVKPPKAEVSLSRFDVRYVPKGEIRAFRRHHRNPILLKI